MTWSSGTGQAEKCFWQIALSHLLSRTNTEIKLDLQVNAISMFAFNPRCLTKIRAETQWDPHPLNSAQTHPEWLAWQTRSCPQSSKILLELLWWTFHWQWHPDQGWVSGHSTILQTILWQTSMEAILVSTRQWTWPECAFTGLAWKQMWLTTSSGVSHASSAAIYQLRCWNPMRSLLDVG